MPTPLPEPSSDFDDAWARFRETHSLRLVPDTLESEWARGRDQYLAFLVSVEDPAVLAHVRRLLARLSYIPGVDPYPEPYWHITIKGVGFLTERPSRPDEVSHRDLESIANAASSLLAEQSTLDARIGPVSAFPEVVFLEVWNEGRIRDLNTLLLEKISLIPSYPIDGRVFLPHISIARFTSADGLPRLKQELAELRAQGPAPSLHIRHIDLITAHLTPSTPTFELLRRYPLAQAAH